MDTNWIKQIIPEFGKTYKANQETRFIVNATEAPKLVIKEGDMDIIFHMILNIQVMKED